MFGRQSSVRLFTVSGIRVGVDASWFLVLFLTIFLFSGPFRDTLHSSDTVAYVTTVITALALFASIIVHELGHALAARRCGVGVTRIDLYLFGGLTQMDRDPLTPGEDFLIAVAGPLATVVVILVCVAVELPLLGSHRLYDGITLQSDIQITPVELALSWLVASNLLLLAFNLLPALPLDGGRIARAAVWRSSGNLRTGTLAAGRLGQMLAFALAAYGVYVLLTTRDWVGLYPLALAWIVWSSARAALARSALDERIDGIRVADVMDVQPVTISAQLTATQAMDEYFARYRWPWFAVVEDDGRFVGLATADDVRASSAAGEEARVGSLVSAGSGRLGVPADSPLTILLGSETLRTFGAAIIVDGDGVLRGVVTVEQVRRALTALTPA